MILPFPQTLSVAAPSEGVPVGNGIATIGNLSPSNPLSTGPASPFAALVEANAFADNSEDNQSITDGNQIGLLRSATEENPASSPQPQGRALQLSPSVDPLPTAPSASGSDQAELVPQSTGKPLPLSPIERQDIAVATPLEEEIIVPPQAEPSVVTPGRALQPKTPAPVPQVEGSDLTGSSYVDPTGPAPDDREDLAPNVSALELAARRGFQKLQAQMEVAATGNNVPEPEAVVPAFSGPLNPFGRSALGPENPEVAPTATTDAASPRLATELNRLKVEIARLADKLGLGKRQDPASPPVGSPFEMQGLTEGPRIASLDPSAFEARNTLSLAAPKIAPTFALSSTLAPEAAPATVASPATLPETSADPASPSQASPTPIAISSPTLASAQSNPPQTAPVQSASPATAIDQFVEQVADTREAARALRPELTVRHAEFGSVAMRLEAGASDWRATLSARDPGFAPTVQAALAERTVTAVGESGLNSNASSHKGSDTPSHSGSQSSQNGSSFTSGFGSSSGGNAPHYGSSTGSSQGSAQPYMGEEGLEGGRHSATDQSDRGPRLGESPPDGARFA